MNLLFPHLYKLAIVTLLAQGACLPALLKAQTAQFVISGNVRVTSSGNNTQIVLHDCDWTNNGLTNAFTPGTGTVRFTGPTGGTSIGGAPTTFYKLTVDKGPTNDLVLNTNISVRDTARLVSGNVDLVNSTLALDSTGRLAGEIYPNGNRFYCEATELGRITARVCLAGGANNNIRDMGLDITMSGGAQCGVTLARGHARQTSASQPVGSIGRYYDITPTVTTGFTYTLNFRYHEQELYNVTESNFVFYRSASYGANNSDWQEWGEANGPTSPGVPGVGVATHNTVNNTVTLGGINTFSRWTVSNSIVTPLPITLIAFNTDCDERQVHIRWSTASEQNNERFTLERSTDLTNWDNIANVAGAGTSNQTLSYETEDPKPVRGISYYRLTQTDYNGTSETFPPVSVNCVGNLNENGMNIYPNPARESFTANILTDRDIADAQLHVFDMNGKTLWIRNLSLTKGNNAVFFGDIALPAGTYFVRTVAENLHIPPAKLVIY